MRIWSGHRARFVKRHRALCECSTTHRGAFGNRLTSTHRRIDDPHHLHGDVVVPAAIVGEFDELSTRLREGSVRHGLSNRTQDVCAKNQVGKSVTCLQKDVAWKQFHRLGSNFDVDFGTHAECTRDLVCLGMTNRFGFGNHAGVDHALHDGVITREWVDLACAYAVRATVSNVCNLESSFAEKQRDDCGTRSSAIIGRAAQEENATTRFFESGLHRGARERSVRSLIDAFEDGGDRSLTRFATTVVTTHSVTEDDEVTETRLAISARVFVDLFGRITPRIGRFGVFDADACARGVRVLHGR